MFIIQEKSTGKFVGRDTHTHSSFDTGMKILTEKISCAETFKTTEEAEDFCKGIESDISGRGWRNDLYIIEVAFKPIKKLPVDFRKQKICGFCEFFGEEIKSRYRYNEFHKCKRSFNPHPNWEHPNILGVCFESHWGDGNSPHCNNYYCKDFQLAKKFQKEGE
jgi:hypothetical protein